ncbi:CPCC family cysteine-rich protein [Faecalimicrobium sp. JNUCC 81]
MNKYTCPCCGYITLPNRGDYYICPLCIWEDDQSQFEHPNLGGGANENSLIEAQINFINFGVSDIRFKYMAGNKNEFKKDPKFKIKKEGL